MATNGPLPAVPPDPGPDDAPFWEAAALDRLVLPRCRGCGNFHLVSPNVLSRLPHVRRGLGQRQRAGHDLQLHGEPARALDLGPTMPLTSSPTCNWRKDPGSSPTSSAQILTR